MKKYSLCALALVLAMLIPMAAACSSGNDNTAVDTTAASTESSANVSGEAADPNAVLEIPENADYDGYEFRIYLYKPGADSVESGYYTSRNYSPIISEEENGEAINDAVYQRNRSTEEKLNIKIVPVIAEKGTLSNKVISDVQAGSTGYDAALQRQRTAQTAGQEGYLVRMDQVDTIHLEKNWWDKTFPSQGAIGNAVYSLVGDATLEDKEGTGCLFYNETVSADYGLGDIYETVDSGKWTFDEMWQQCKKVSVDLNGDGIVNEHDRMGIGMSHISIRAYLNAFNAGYAYLEDGVPVSGLDDEFTITAVMKFAEVFNDSSCVLKSSLASDGWNTFTVMFKDDRMLLRSGCIYNAPPFRDMESEFSIIPLPKYDENQDKYYASLSPQASPGYAIPVTCTDPERVGVILETMGYLSGDIIDAYINVTLEDKIARNEESVKILRMIMENAFYDIGYIYNWAKIDSVVQGAVKVYESTIASAYAGVRDQYLAAMEETYNLYK